jgi:asparagine synthase (glutamine-hydrolysing)
VKIVGTYGSEIVRHAVMFKPTALLPGLFSADFDSYTARAQTTYARIRLQHPVTFAAFSQSPWYHHGILSLEQTQLTVRSPYLDNDFVRTVYRAPQVGDRSADVRLRLISDGNSELGRIRSDRGVGGQPGVGSIVARGLLEFTFKAEYAYDYGMPQWLAGVDNTFAPFHFERLFLGRHKFSHYRLWYRNALAEYVRQILLDPRTLSRPYIQRRGVEAVVEGHTRGGRNYTTEIHKLLTLELLQRQFLDSK